MRYLIITFIFLLFFSGTLFTQVLIKGRLLNKKTKEPVQYASVVWKNINGTISDEKGFFYLPIDQLTSNEDSIFFHNISFHNKVITIEQFHSNKSKIFYLEPKDYKLPEISVFAKKMKSKKYGIYKKRPYTGWNGRKGSIIALKMNYDYNSKGIIKNIQFFITDRGFNPTNKFRAHIYKVDSITGGIGKELLPETVIANATKGNEWVIIDVLKYGIKLPKKGFFVGIEYLTNGKGDYSGQGAYIERNNVQIGLSMEKDKKSLTWVFRPNNQKWKKWEDQKDGKKIFKSPNVNIAAEVLIEKRNLTKTILKWF